MNKAVIQLKELLHGTSFESHAKPGSFVLKPAVGACGGHIGFISQDGDLQKQFKKHSRAHPIVREWLLQPFFPRMPLGEYKVFVGPDGETMVTYSPMYLKSKSSSVIFCPAGHVYNDMFILDDCVEPGPVNAKPGKAESLVCKTWENKPMHDAIVSFARKCRDAFAGRTEMHCLASTVCRVDIICLFGIKSMDSRVALLNTAEPILLLNEMDNLWSASLLLDINNPLRDSLCKLLPESAVHPVAERTAVQHGWIRGLNELLVNPVVDEQQPTIGPVVEQQQPMTDPEGEQQQELMAGILDQHSLMATVDQQQLAVDTFLDGVMEFTGVSTDYVQFSRQLQQDLFSMFMTSDMTQIEFMQRVISYFTSKQCWKERCHVPGPVSGRKNVRNVAFRYKLRS